MATAHATQLSGLPASLSVGAVVWAAARLRLIRLSPDVGVRVMVESKEDKDRLVATEVQLGSHGDGSKH